MCMQCGLSELCKCILNIKSRSHNVHELYSRGFLFNGKKHKQNPKANSEF